MSEQRIAEVFVELADTLVDDFDVLDFLHVLTDRCVELLEVTASGLMLSDERGRLQLVAGTSRRTQDLELLELEMEEGPCLDAFATGEAIVNVSPAEAARRWPNFTRAALESGVLRTSALPMRLRGRVVGALNLFSGTDVDMTPTKLALGQAMADIATIGLLNERSLREKTVLSEQLQAALQSRVVIEQAKGVLAARLGITVVEAFQRLRNHARRSGSSLTDLAAGIVAGRSELEDALSTPSLPVDGWEND